MLLPSALKLYTGETQRLIVASGKLTQPEFAETAIFVFRHTPMDALGVIINRPLPEGDLKKIPKYLQGKNLPIYYGGPVGYPDYVFVIERYKDADGKTILTSQGFDDASKLDPDYLKKIETSVAKGGNDYRIYIGCAGWGVFQLGNEFRRGVWASTDLNLDWLFFHDMTPREVWLNALQEAFTKQKPRNPGLI